LTHTVDYSKGDGLA